MHFYGISYREMLALPIYAFWEMSRNVGRIMAEEDIRLFQVIQNAAWSSEPQEYIDNLTSERGVVVLSDKGAAPTEAPDTEGLNKLRMFLGQSSK